MKEYIPFPARVFMGPRSSKSGGDVTMILALVPGHITDDEELFVGDIMLVRKECSNADKYYGWKAEDILRDGIQPDPPKEIDYDREKNNKGD